jgi:hypothetical protein
MLMEDERDNKAISMFLENSNMIGDYACFQIGGAEMIQMFELGASIVAGTV